MPRPIVFCSDYGFQDPFVGLCHAVIERRAPGTLVIDLWHEVPPHDVLAGAVVLADAAPFLPPNPVVLAVVDPGVGGSRRAMIAQAEDGATLVGPDNGLLAPALEAHGGVLAALEIIIPGDTPATFHGRDVFAPAAADLAMSVAAEELGRPIESASLASLQIPAPIRDGRFFDLTVLGVDRFGNVQTNLRRSDALASKIGAEIALEGGTVLPFVRTFADLPDGSPGALWDSWGRFAIVVNLGSAAARFGLASGSGVRIEGG